MNSSTAIPVSKRLCQTLLAAAGREKKSLFFCIIQILLMSTFSAASFAAIPEEPISLSEQEKTWLAEHKTVRIAFDGYFPPYSFLNDAREFEGLAVDIVGVLAERTGINIETYPNATWKELYSAAQKQEVDVVATMVKRPEREEWFTFTQPYIFKSLVIMTSKEYTGIQRREDLAGKTVAFVQDYQYVKRIMKEFPSVKPFYVDKMLDALNAVSTGKADAAITHLGGGHYLKAKYFLSNLKFAAIYDRNSSLESIAVRKDLPELASIFDKVLSSLSEKEKLQIQKKWLPLDYISTVEKNFELTQKEKAWISDHPVIRLGIDPEFAPFEFIAEDGSYSGITSDYIKTLNKRLGLNMQIVPELTWKEAVDKTRAGEIDVLPSVGLTEQRKTFLNYSRPYINFHRVIISRADTPFLTGIDDIRGLKVAVQVDTSHEGYLYDNTDILPMTYKTLQKALMAVSNGVADVFVGNIASATFWIRKLNLTNLKVAAPVSFETETLHFAVRKDWPILVSIINKGLASVSQGEKTEIRRKWVAVEYRPGIALKNILRVAGAVLLVLVVILIWNYSLKNEIRKRKKTEAELRKLSRAVEQSPSTVIITDTKGEIEYANPKFTSITGYNIEEVIGKTPSILKSGYTSRQEYAKLWQTISSGQEWRGTFRNRKKSGDLYWESASISSIKNEKGEVTHYIGVKEDITARKKTEEALKESEEKFRQIADTIHDIFWMTSPDGSEVIYINPSFEKLWGVSSEALYKDSSLWMKPILFEDRGMVQEMFTYDRLTKGEFDVEFRILNAKGNVSWIHAVGYPIRNNKGEVYRISGIASDITKFKEIDRLKSMFIASMSHELRTPLNSIIGFTGMTFQELSGELNEEQKDNLGRVYKSSKHLLGLISDVIDISKIEASRIDIFPKEFLFEELVDEAIDSVRPQIKEKGLAIDVHNIPDIIMNTDRKRLLQCFLNLLSNAVKYTEAGKITVTAKAVNGDVEFNVSDTGIGIEDSDMPRLFEAFERMQTHLRVKAGGTGLGLYLTKKILHELLRGSIAVQSHAGRGSTFTIRVPKYLEQVAKSQKQSIEVS
jgi:PAS domain S-box-containing protein